MAKNKKKILWIAVAALIACAAVILLLPKGETPITGENLLINSSFDVSEGASLPNGWYTDAYARTAGYTDFSVDEGRDGGFSVHIKNNAGNDARFAQSVHVEKNSLYLLHGYIKASTEGGLGANLSVEGVYTFSDCIYETNGTWQEVSMYGRTGPNQTSMTVFARLGGYSGETVGEAWFDDVTLTRVSEVPDAYSAMDLYQDYSYVDETPAEYSGSDTYAVLILGCAVLYLLYALLLKDHSEKSESKLILPLLLLASIIIRIVIAKVIPGYDVDTGCFTAWANRMVQMGPGFFYSGEYFCDYPPGYMLILWPFGLIGQLLGTGATEFLIKLPPILADTVCAFVLYKRAKQVLPGKKAYIALLYILNPLVLCTGAAFGQCDSVMTMLLLFVVLGAMDGKWKLALPCYMAAVLVKPQALMFGPLGLIALVYAFIKEKDKKALLNDVLIGLIALIAVFLAVCLPFDAGRGLTWLTELYAGTMNFYDYATVNACNGYFLLGLNWFAADNGVDILPALCAALMAALPLVLTRKLPGYIMAGVILAAGILMPVLGLSIADLSFVMIIACVAITAYYYISGKSITHLPLIGATLLILLFNTADMMHERYLFPAVVLLVLALIYEKDRRVLFTLILVTIAGFLNVSCVLSRNVRIGGAEGHLTAPLFGIESDMTVLEYLSAILNMLSALLLSAVTALICVRNEKALPIESAEPDDEVTLKRDQIDLTQDEKGTWLQEHKLDKLDRIIILAVTALYACLAFWHLGSTKAPQREYVLSEDEEVIFDLGEHQDGVRMLYYGGIHYYDCEFTVSTSDDLENWSNEIFEIMADGDCFTWKYVSDDTGNRAAVLNGRYVKIYSVNMGLTLFEVILHDENGQVLPVTVTTTDDYDPSALIDEQDTLDGEPGWFNSMYFDEIYHARTAYEHLYGLVPYETTHPPLGKVIMSFFIGLFGMVPFGWRFAGTLCGVMMLPGMYLLGKILFKKRRYAIFAMLMLTFDTMHYTQTRLATIDSFVVLFIIWAVYFMLRWFFADFKNAPLWKTLIPLGLSGLFMGLAVASKWTGCYAGVGLAVLFFLRLFNHCRAANRMENADKKKMYMRMLYTVLSCFVFFILIPCVIYYVSYIPYFAPTGGVSIENIVQAAEGMFSYHATPGLGMDHAFYSPWYEWPLSIKPMYYAADSYEPVGMACTILAFGNPAVWWIGLIGMLLILYALCRHQLIPAAKGRYLTDKHYLLAPLGQRDVRPAILMICFAAQFLPWTLVPRGTYIYHYFPSVPFIILCTALCTEYVEEYCVDLAGVKWTNTDKKRMDRLMLILLCVLIALAAAMFVIYFPYASGKLASTSYLRSINLLHNLYF